MNQNTKTIQRLSIRAVAVALTLALCAFAISCSKDDSTPAPTQSIVAIAQGNTNLTTLVAALTKYPDLVSTLSGTGTFTVFAPSNQAFTTLLAAIGQTSLDDIPEPVLKNILQYHVVSSAALRSNQLTAGNVNTVANENIAVTLNPLKLNGSVNVTTADVLATNGVVHVVDAVLVNPSVLPIVGTIVAPAYFNKNFSTLVAAVVKADVLTTLLNATPQKTLFAPTNAAFVTYLGVANDAAAVAAINGLAPSAVADILTFHLISGSKINAGNIAAGTTRVTTARSVNNFAFVTKTGTAVTINNARVTTADVNGSNGVVHVIDAVLTPPVGNIVGVATSTANAANFNILATALTKADLISAVSAAGPLTVFAPTDAAFLTLLRSSAFFNNADLSEAQVLDYLNTITASSTPLSLTLLSTVLTYHVVSASGYSINLSNNQVLTTLKAAAPNTVTIRTGTSVTVTGSAAGAVASNVSTANISATNGVVHVIDRVLLP